MCFVCVCVTILRCPRPSACVVWRSINVRGLAFEMERAVKTELDVKSFGQNVLRAEFIMCRFPPSDVLLERCAFAGASASMGRYKGLVRGGCLRASCRWSMMDSSPVLLSLSFFYFITTCIWLSRIKLTLS